MKKIKSINELSAVLLPLAKQMVEEQTNYVYETLNYFIQRYYSSYSPKSYRRIYDFMYSVVKVEPKIAGNTVAAIVYIDYDSMDNYRSATGYEVVNWANQGLHGGIEVKVGSPHVWDDTIENAIENDELLKNAIKFLKNKGIVVRQKG